MLQQTTVEQVLTEIGKALKPNFAPYHSDWLPVPAHANDAGADLKAWIDTITTYSVIQGIYNRLLLQYTKSKIFINGKEVTDFEQDSLALKHESGYSYILLPPEEQKLVNVGFKIGLPTLPKPFTACYRVSPRSGLANKFGITIVNSPGLIDCHYRNDVGVILKNTGDSCHFFSHGARIAQGAYEILVDQSTWTPEELLVDSLDETVRKGGFGHTGM